MYRLATIIVVGCIIAATHSLTASPSLDRLKVVVENRTAKISASGITMGSAVTLPWLFQTRNFSAVRFCSYTVRRTQYDRPSERQLGLHS